MGKELCNDGRCKRVRLGEDRHPSHIGKKEKINDKKENPYDFEKN